MINLLARLKKVQPGQGILDALTADFINAITDCIIALARGDNHKQGANIRKKFGSGWVMLSANPVAGSSGSATRRDFYLYDASTESTLRIGVAFGLVTPYSAASGLNPWPDVFNAGTTPKYKYEFDVTATGSAWIEMGNDVSGDTDVCNLITMGHGDTFPDPSPVNGYLAAGAWTVVGTTLTITSGTEGIGNQFYSFCAGTHSFRRA